MSALTVLILIFAGLGAFDYLLGGKFGIGKEFEKGFALLGTMALAMIGMIVIAPLLADWLAPVFDGVYKLFHIDPSIIPASILANDMGGAPLSVAVAKDPAIGRFNGVVVSCMMGATLSYTIPVGLSLVDKSHHRQMAFGLLCGLVTVPIGCFVAGLICKLPLGALLLDLLPLLLLSAIISTGLVLAPEACVKIFKGFGFFIKALIMVGLLLGAINFLGKEEVIQGLGSVEEGAVICVNASLVLAGMFPLIYLLSKLLDKPLVKLGNKLEMTSTGVTGLMATLVSSTPTYGNMNAMDDKSIMVNSAFSVSAAFSLGGHLAFTMAFDDSYLLPVIVGKVVAGVFALAFAFFLFGKLNKKNKRTEGIE